MKKAAIVLAVVLAAWLGAWAVAARIVPAPVRVAAEPLDPATPRNVTIGPVEEALTFARVARDGATHLLLVSIYADDVLGAVDLTALWPELAPDPVTVFNAKGYDAIAAVAADRVPVDAAELLLPFDGTPAQIAMGVNYPEHGREVAVGASFLFPKMTVATPSRADVPARAHLLDYEVELGFVALAPIARGVVPEYVGLVLASDYTDRAALLRHINLRDVPSGDGFTQGKSAPGFMPVGNLFVIPRNYDAFYRTLQLRLWRNGELQQVAEPNLLHWDFRQMLHETFARADRQWQWNGRPVGLPLDHGAIPVRTLLLSGTPGGVIFAPPTPRQLFVGASELVFTLDWGNPHRILEPCLRDGYRYGNFLKPGDEVVMHADRLGVIHNRIVAQ